jgi:hypothetical protein
MQADAADRFEAAGGCPCCTAGPVFRAALVRLLRAGPWQRLHVEVDPSGHAGAVVDQLRSPPFDRLLEVQALLVTVDPASWRDAAPGVGDGRAAARLGFAGDFLLRDDAGPAAVAACARDLGAMPPWPRSAAPSEAWASDGTRLPGDERTDAGRSLPDRLEGWRMLRVLPVAQLDRGACLARRWSGNAIARRREFLHRLAALADQPGVEGLQALVRTPRAWYRWASGRGGGPGTLSFEAGPGVREEETTWRLDSRLCLWLSPAALRAPIEARLRALDDAFDEVFDDLGKGVGSAAETAP